MFYHGQGQTGIDVTHNRIIHINNMHALVLFIAVYYCLLYTLVCIQWQVARSNQKII